MIIHKCDKCGKTVKGRKGKADTLPTGWYPLTYGRYSSERVEYHICPECRVLLKIPTEAPAKTVGENLLELIEEIAGEAGAEAAQNV